MKRPELSERAKYNVFRTVIVGGAVSAVALGGFLGIAIGSTVIAEPEPRVIEPCPDECEGLVVVDDEAALGQLSATTREHNTRRAGYALAPAELACRVVADNGASETVLSSVGMLALDQGNQIMIPGESNLPTGLAWRQSVPA